MKWYIQLSNVYSTIALDHIVIYLKMVHLLTVDYYRTVETCMFIDFFLRRNIAMRRSWRFYKLLLDLPNRFL